MPDPITPGRDCIQVWRVVSSMPSRWWTVYAVQREVPRYTGETVARKLRKLRTLGLLDWRKVADNNTGGRFTDYRVARYHGCGQQWEADGSRPLVAIKRPPLPKDEPPGDKLFDLPEPDRDWIERQNRRAAR